MDAASDDRGGRGGRTPSTTLGAEPRTPDALVAETERALAALARRSNLKVRAQIAGLLRDTEDGQLDKRELESAIKRLRLVRLVPPTGAAKRSAIKLFEAVDKFNARDIRRTLGIPAPELTGKLGEKWRKRHVALISSIETSSHDRVRALLLESAAKQTRVETLRNRLVEEFDICERRARLIARDQVLTLNARLNEHRQRAAGITRYKWRVIDSAARKHHRELDGKIFEYAKPPLGGGTGPDDRGNPGDGIGCRCQAIPVLDDLKT